MALMMNPCLGQKLESHESLDGGTDSFAQIL